jgi:type VI protein secretion system component VasK
MGAAFLTKNYLLVVLLVFLAMAVATYALANQTYLTTTQAVANQTQQQINAIRQTTTSESIFLNNFFVSILAIVPVGAYLLR